MNTQAQEPGAVAEGNASLAPIFAGAEYLARDAETKAQTETENQARQDPSAPQAEEPRPSHDEHAPEENESTADAKPRTENAEPSHEQSANQAPDSAEPQSESQSEEPNPVSAASQTSDSHPAASEAPEPLSSPDEKPVPEDSVAPSPVAKLFNTAQSPLTPYDFVLDPSGELPFVKPTAYSPSDGTLIPFGLDSQATDESPSREVLLTSSETRKEHAASRPIPRPAKSQDKPSAPSPGDTASYLALIDNYSPNEVQVSTSKGKHAKRMVGYAALPGNPYLLVEQEQTQPSAGKPAKSKDEQAGESVPANAKAAKRRVKRAPRRRRPSVYDDYDSTYGFDDRATPAKPRTWLLPSVLMIVLFVFLCVEVTMIAEVAYADEGEQEYTELVDVPEPETQSGQSMVTLTTPPTPAAPQVAAIGDTWVLLVDVPGMEWRISSERPIASLTTSALFDIATKRGRAISAQASEWQTSPLFEGLNREYHYEFEGRLAEFPDIISETVAVGETWGVPTEPVIIGRGENWIEVRDDSGDGLTTGPILEYTCFPEGSTGPYEWQDSTLFTGLEPGVTYKIRSRVKQSAASTAERSDSDGWSFPATVKTMDDPKTAQTPESPDTPGSPSSPTSPGSPATPASPNKASGTNTPGPSSGVTSGTTTVPTYSSDNVTPVSSGSAKVTPATGDANTLAALVFAVLGGAGLVVLSLLVRDGEDKR